MQTWSFFSEGDARAGELDRPRLGVGDRGVEDPSFFFPGPEAPEGPACENLHFSPCLQPFFDWWKWHGFSFADCGEDFAAGAAVFFPPCLESAP